MLHALVKSTGGLVGLCLQAGLVWSQEGSHKEGLLTFGAPQMDPFALGSLLRIYGFNAEYK